VAEGHGRAVQGRLVIVERKRPAKELAGGIGRFASRGGQRRDLEVIRERRQGRNVPLRRPSAIRIRADDADPNPLGATVDPHQATAFTSWRRRISPASAATALARLARISSSVSPPSSKRV